MLKGNTKTKPPLIVSFCLFCQPYIDQWLFIGTFLRKETCLNYCGFVIYLSLACFARNIGYIVFSFTRNMTCDTSHNLFPVTHCSFWMMVIIVCRNTNLQEMLLLRCPCSTCMSSNANRNWQKVNGSSVQRHCINWNILAPRHNCDCISHKWRCNLICRAGCAYLTIKSTTEQIISALSTQTRTLSPIVSQRCQLIHWQWTASGAVTL